MTKWKAKIYEAPVLDLRNEPEPWAKLAAYLATESMAASAYGATEVHFNYWPAIAPHLIKVEVSIEPEYHAGYCATEQADGCDCWASGRQKGDKERG